MPMDRDIDTPGKGSYSTYKVATREGAMIQAGIKEIKNNLSRFLAQVKSGQEILITEHGKPVARIIREHSNNIAIRTALRPLLEKGLVVLPTRRLKKEGLVCHKTAGKLTSEMVIEDRR